ncbi:hypothetical protein BJY52DRAFT_1288610 [Lactarius psammicola]|nr:hypothetical protein BJY52DRAFT_1288610 [Lactarius psammicola]
MPLEDVEGMESRNEDPLARQKRDSAVWRSEQYRKLLAQFTEPEDEQQPVAISSSQSAPATPSSRQATPRQELSLLARHEDDGRQRHQRTLATPEPELGPPEIVRRNPENERGFVGIIAALCADNSPHNRAAIFSAGGLGDYQMAPQEAACARNTPDIPWTAFTNIFGGNLHCERPKGTRVPGYMGNILCANNLTQPFAPTCIGEPGVILSLPGSALVEDTGERFHVLVDWSVEGKKTKLRYYGIYTVYSPYVEIQIDDWYSLPKQCRNRLLRQLGVSKVGALHARCNLRKRLGTASIPSPAEIDEWVRSFDRGSEVREYGALRHSFDSGMEKLGFEVIRCVGYDVKFAELIQ